MSIWLYFETTTTAKQNKKGEDIDIWNPKSLQTLYVFNERN